jgi:protein-ribulosamine 3-kinase
VIPKAVHDWLEENGLGVVKATHPVSGGCINNGTRLETDRGEWFFLKTNTRLPPDTFSREAAGLAALRVSDGPRVPEPLLHGPGFLLIEDLASAPRRSDFWESLGNQLAALHHHTNDQFGFDHDNYLGSTPQMNPWMADGYAFFAEARLIFQANLARLNGHFQPAEVQMVERLCSRLPELVPEQPASLLHGDLWSGNVISDSAGQPAIIDPAVYYGWAEAEIGMTALFGGFGEAFYRTYEAAARLEPGWRDRLEIYNLYQLLNHLNIFGRGYYGQVMAVLNRYA